VGIGMAALPAGILANGLATQLNRKREVMAEQFRMALQDGNIDDHEADAIEELRKDLGVSVNVANGILETVQKNKVKTKLHFCPNCGESLSQYVKETV
jgi:voltage-gated potassium channel